MRLLILSSEFPPGPGGIGTHAQQTAINLQKAGWEIQVITSQDYVTEQEIIEFNRKQPFPVHRFRAISPPVREGLYRWRETSRVIREWKPDLLLATGERSVWLGATLAKWHRLPWAAVGHGSEFRFQRAWERILTRWSFNQADGVICVSEFTWHRMRAANIKPKKGEIIPNGADSKQFRILPSSEIEEFRRNFGLQGAQILVTVGNLTERKGQDIVIKALPDIIKEFPDTHYVMIGLPTRQEELHQLAADLKVEQHVHFLGRLDAALLICLLNSCDVFVMTSKQTEDGDCEGYGIAAVEAALCGKPAVVSSGSGLAEAISDSVTGFAVPESDPSATAKAITALLKDPDLRMKMGEAARRRALDEQTWEHRVIQYDRFFRSLLKLPEPSGSPQLAGPVSRTNR
jgi:phosphatidylinositol alpha-1,6-mannosyltransferase